MTVALERSTKLRVRRRWLFLLTSLVVLPILVVTGCNLWILIAGRPMTDDPAAVEKAQVGIVLGALVRGKGELSGMLEDRVEQGFRLYKAGRVSKLLVSGDNTRRGYDETDSMRLALQKRGVPAKDIFTDYAGIDTWNSMSRARQVFGVQSAVVVTQGFHLPRAVFLAKQAGLKASGVSSDLHGYGQKGTESSLREVAARVKGFWQGVRKPSVLLGPTFNINADGRKSWDKQFSGPE